MGFVPEPAFRSLVGALGSERFADLVAAIWRARGYDVERDGGLLVATDGDDREVIQPIPARVAGRVRPAGGPASDEVTTVVLGDATPPRWVDGTPVEVVDAGDLRELLLFGVPAARRDELFERFFDRSARSRPVDETRFARLAPLLPASLSRALGAAATRPDLRAGATVLVAALFVVAALGGGVLFANDGPDPTTPAPTTAEPRPTSTPTLAPLADRETARRPAGATPPGIAPDGSVNLSQLLAAHIQNVSRTSYTLTLVRRESGGGSDGYATEEIRRFTQTNYVTAVRRDGTLTEDGWPVADVEMYADGARRFERRVRNGTVSYQSGAVYTGRIGRPARRGGVVLVGALEEAETSLVARFERAGRTMYRLRFETGLETGRVGSGVAVVSETGVVRFLRWQYAPVDRDTEVTVVMRYGRFGETTATQPPWAEAARNATAGRD